jgi:hypothetical protein
MRAVAAALLALLLTACGGLEEATGIRDPFGTPLPFRGTGDQNLVVGLLGERPVFIGPIEGLTAKADAALRAEIAKQAEAFDVMASATTMPAQGLSLAGVSQAGSAAFTLFDGTTPIATFAATGDPALLAASAARQLAQAMGRLGDAPAAVAATSAPVIFIREVSGPSAAITNPLKRAIHDKLAEFGARMSEAPADGAYVISGAITLTEGPDARVGVAIVWKVYAPDGTDLGNADQNNTLPAEAVKATWPEIATMAGRAAAGSVAQIIARHFRPKT